ncbi:arginine N-succinyltransferase [Marinobacterium zhoushanense]|uniref:Arginine N-succinyltransferase n=1 Tax=Marinobacterium zhoushanense TaxID=1679163 RepID=A0ABQ1K1F2_9GAMM|nr:arginine N-succinyltransferase [Marinobacterium zhoushanense]GGB80784.1 arginine N-succinyltransferase [Marinobacterium zhoushanense]
MIIRPITDQDLEALYQIAVESGPGFMSLPNDRDFLKRKIRRSVDSFTRAATEPGGESYLFVLEDSETGDVMGTTGIESSVGLRQPLYHFQHSRQTYRSRDLNISNHVEMLNLCSHYTGCTEICTLYLRPQYRQKDYAQQEQHRQYAGKLLSKVRFLFMAQHPERFAETVIAEMRGVSDEAGRSPFWDWMRQHFLDMDFATVTLLAGSGNSDFIAELMPRYPLHTHLLSPAAQSVIGEVHDKTRPALKLLQNEGFVHRGYVDPFDAGPTVEAKLTEIRSIAGSTPCRIELADDDQQLEQVSDSLIMLANTSVKRFRAGIADKALYHPADGVLEISHALAESLQLRQGESARFLQLPLSGTPAMDAVFAVPADKEQIHAR